MSTYETRPVLAGAYRGKRALLKSTLTHTVELDENGVEARVLCGRVDLDSIADRCAVGDAERAAQPSCQACAGKDPRGGCQAIVDKMVTRGPYRVADDKPCSRRGGERVGHLLLCLPHAQMAREGLLSEEGRVASRADIANVRRFPARYSGGIYHWFVGTERKP